MNQPALVDQRGARNKGVALLTGGGDRPYALGLAMELASKGVCVDFIGSDQLDSPVLRMSPRLNFLNLRGSQREDVSFPRKVWRVLIFYARLIRYAATASPRIFHILWNNKFELFDRTVLMLYYKLRGRKIVLTAHNVNAGRRDARDSMINRLTLKTQYRLADHIFVHAEAMKRELLEDFGVREGAITVIPIGINNSVPDTDLTGEQARQRLGIGRGDRTILFFGYIGPYKGVELLVDAFQRLASTDPRWRLIIAGKPKKGDEKYFAEIQRAIECDVSRGRVLQRIGFIPDEETEWYFKAADVLALPYTRVYQSGVLVLGYTFGLPVIAADVGSLREEIVEGETGFLCKPGDSIALARTIETYFESDLFKGLDRRRQEIRDYASKRYSWEAVSRRTRTVYDELLAG